MPGAIIKIKRIDQNIIKIIGGMRHSVNDKKAPEMPGMSAAGLAGTPRARMLPAAAVTPRHEMNIGARLDAHACIVKMSTTMAISPRENRHHFGAVEARIDGYSCSSLMSRKRLLC